VNWMRRAQRVLLVALVVWVGVHTLMVWRTGWTSWRLGGLGMYAEPSLEYRGAAVVRCRERTCAAERPEAEHFAPTDHWDVPLLAPTPAGEARYALVGTRSGRFGRLSFGLEAFRRIPTGWHAEGLVDALLAEPCGPYLVVLYTQHVSMWSRDTTVDHRSFVVEYEPCPTGL
jgi:hypothetical protein